MNTESRMEFVTNSPEETVELGAKLAGQFPRRCLIILQGELGAGKTTLVKGIVKGLGAASEEEVTSPSFTLVHEYGSERKVYHADLYRIEGELDVATLGIEELIEQEAVVIIEWGEKYPLRAAEAQVRIEIDLAGGDERRISVETCGNAA